MAEAACVLCQIAGSQVAAAIVVDDQQIMAIMDLFPATRGHALVFPKQHIENIYELPEAVGASIMARAIQLAKVMQQELRPDGVNLIQSNGAAAGQTIRHFHLHVVPRYQNDAIELRFGHHTHAASREELEGIAHELRSALARSGDDSHG